MATRKQNTTNSVPSDEGKQNFTVQGEPTGLVPIVVPQGSAELGEPNKSEPMTEAEATAAREAAAKRYYELYYAGHGTPASNIPAVEDEDGQLVDMEGRGLDVLAVDATIDEDELNEVPAADESRVEREGEATNVEGQTSDNA